MSSSAWTGFGCKLEYETLNSSPPTWNFVTQLRKIDFSGKKTDVNDVSNMDSPSAYKEKRPNLIDAGDLSFDGVLPIDPATGGFGSLRTLQDARSIVSWRVTEPTSTLAGAETTPARYTFDGFVSELASSFSYDKESTFSGKITITGAVSSTEAA